MNLFALNLRAVLVAVYAGFRTSCQDGSTNERDESKWQKERTIQPIFRPKLRLKRSARKWRWLNCQRSMECIRPRLGHGSAQRSRIWPLHLPSLVVIRADRWNSNRQATFQDWPVSGGTEFLSIASVQGSEHEAKIGEQGSWFERLAAMRPVVVDAVEPVLSAQGWKCWEFAVHGNNRQAVSGNALVWVTANGAAYATSGS